MGLQAELSVAFEPLREACLGVLLWGSHATGDETPRSDVDICIVAGPEAAPGALLSRAWREVDPRGHRLDIHVFEELPLHLKAAVIEHHRVLVARDEPGLYEHFVLYRRLWHEQAHRNSLTEEEARRVVRG